MKFLIKHTTQSNPNGFTLVELSITVVISSIIALSAASLVLISSNQLTLSEIDVETVRDHALVTQYLAEEIKEGLSQYSTIYADSNKTAPAVSGSCLSIMTPDSSTVTFYRGGANDFVVRKGNGRKNRLIRQAISGLTFTDSYSPDSTRIVKVSLTTDRNGSPITTNHYYQFRN